MAVGVQRTGWARGAGMWVRAHSRCSENLHIEKLSCPPLTAAAPLCAHLADIAGLVPYEAQKHLLNRYALDYQSSVSD